jgi:hypothetical protein
MTNDAKDAHVLAAAVASGAHAIVSDNKKHFPAAALAPHSLECLTAGEFLSHQYHLDSDAFISLLEAQAKNINKPLRDLVARLPAPVAELIKI